MRWERVKKNSSPDGRNRQPREVLAKSLVAAQDIAVGDEIKARK